MKVLLVERGEPFSLPPDEERAESGTFSHSPFLDIERMKGRFSGMAPYSWHHDACVLPAALYLEAGARSIPVPAIVYGSAGMAFPCFEEGAADFMREGWTMLELEARLYRLWQPRLAAGDRTFSLRGSSLVREADRAGQPDSALRLSPAEAALLRCLLSAPGRIVAPETPARSGTLTRAASKARSMLVSRLRAKLSGLEPGLGDHIQAARGSGHLWINS